MGEMGRQKGPSKQVHKWTSGWKSGRRSYLQSCSFKHASCERCNTGPLQSPQDSGHSNHESPLMSSRSAGNFYHQNCQGLTWGRNSTSICSLDTTAIIALKGASGGNEKQKTVATTGKRQARNKVARKGFNAYLFLPESKLGFLSVTSYCHLDHKLRVICTQKQEIQLTSYWWIPVVTSSSEWAMSKSDSKYSIIKLHGLRMHIHENLYFINWKWILGAGPHPVIWIPASCCASWDSQRLQSVSLHSQHCCLWVATQ